MRGIGQERGVTAVVTALVIVLMVGFTALAVDVGALWWDRKELQNGADAAALALAQECADANGAPGCENDRPLAVSYAQSNKSAQSTDNEAGIPTGGIRRVDADGNPDPNGHYVEVTVEAQGRSWFSVAVGFGPIRVAAQATAAWGGVGAGTGLPLTVSECFLKLVEKGQRIVIPIKASAKEAFGRDPDKDCGGDPHNIPGGFGWLVPDDLNKCVVTLSAYGPVAKSKPGTPIHDTGDCATRIDEALAKSLVIRIPVFTEAYGTGKNGRYLISGFAEMEIISACFHDSGKPKSIKDGNCNKPPAPLTKGAFIEVKFLEMHSLTDTPGGADYGVTTVGLTR